MTILAGIISVALAHLAQAADAAVNRAVTKGFAGEVLVTDAKRTIYARVVSDARRQHHHQGELWRWASVTKQLTATLTMQAVESGKLSLNDTLATRLPAFRGPTAGAITLRMLLQHTSGLPNPDDTPRASGDEFPSFYRRSNPGAGGPADALGYCAGTPKAAPGAGFAYNNCDYIVLGAVLERATGKRYADLVRDGIARPAKLRSLAVAGPTTSPKLVSGFDENGKPEPPFSLAAFGPAGAAYGSADDLAGFDRALLNDRLLETASTATAWKGDPKLGYVALGVWSFEAPLKGCGKAVRLIERRGEIGGVEVRNLISPDAKRALVVFADRAGLDFGEVWQGKGLTYEFASAAFCTRSR